MMRITHESTPWFTRREAARYARVDPTTIDRARLRGDLAGSRIAGGHRYRYHREDLDAWLGRPRLRVVR